MTPLDKPINAQEKYLYGIIERLDMLIDLLNQNNTSIEEIQPEIIVKPKRPKKG